MKLVKSILLSTSLLVSASYAETKINPKSVVAALNDVTYKGVFRYRNNNNNTKGATNKKSTTDIDFNINLSVPMSDDLKLVFGVGSQSNPNGDNRTGNSVTKMNVDLLRSYFIYSQPNLKIKAGQMTLGLPISDNSPINPIIGNGAIVSYDFDKITLVGSHFLGAEHIKYYNMMHTSIDESNISYLGVKTNYNAFKFNAYAVRAQNVFDSLYFVEGGVKFPYGSLLMQGINTKVDKSLGGKNGLYYAVEAKAKVEKFSARVGYTKNDKDQGLYSFAGKDSSGLIYSGGEMASAIDNVADAQSVYSDITVSMNKFHVKCGYAKGEIGSNELKEYYAQVGYNYKPNIRTRVYYSDLEDDNKSAITNELLRFEVLYKF